jgi:uncharacterized membrane protein
VNWPHLHLMSNHLPVILSVVAAGAAIVALIARRRAVWMYAAISLTLAGLFVGPIFIAGKQAGIAVERMASPPQRVIDAHAETAEMALIVLLVAGVVGGIGWWRLAVSREREIPPMWLRALLVIAALAGAGVVGYTSLLGGMIYHGPAGNSRPTAWDSLPPAVRSAATPR